MTAALALAAVLTLPLAGCSAPAAPVPSPERITALPEGAELLFVARAATGTLEATGDTGTLTLDALTVVSWFTDRPARQAGLTSIEDALASLGWTSDTNSFGDNPPNAELTANELGAASVAIELESADVEASRVTFEVTALDGATLASTSLTALELFIDAGAAPQQKTLELQGGMTVLMTLDATIVDVQFQQGGETFGEVRITVGSPPTDFNFGSANGTLDIRTQGSTTVLEGDFQYEPDPGPPFMFAGAMAEWTAAPTPPDPAPAPEP